MATEGPDPAVESAHAAPAEASGARAGDPPPVDADAQHADVVSRHVPPTGSLLPESGDERTATNPDSEPMSGGSASETSEGPVRDSLDVASPAAPDPVIRAPRDDGRRGPGIGAMAASGILGGLVGAGLLYGIETWRTQATSDPHMARDEQQVTTSARPENLGVLEGRLAALEGAQSGLVQRVQAAQTMAERSAARAEEAASRPAPAPVSTPQDDAALRDLPNRLSDLETQVRDRVQAAVGATQMIERRLAGQEQRLAGASQPLERRLGEVEQRLAGATQLLERRVAQQDERLAALTRQVAEGGSDVTRAGTRVVLADRLGDALREGRPYADVLAGLRRLTPDAATLTPLEPFSQSGAPTAGSLAQDFKPVAERLQREARQGPGDWTERLLRMADKVVTVRAVNEPAETGVSGTVARIEDALARNAFGDAAKAWESLPEPARQASMEWGQRLAQRAAAEAASRTVAADAVATLNQATR